MFGSIFIVTFVLFSLFLDPIHGGQCEDLNWEESKFLTRLINFGIDWFPLSHRYLRSNLPFLTFMNITDGLPPTISQTTSFLGSEYDIHLTPRQATVRDLYGLVASPIQFNSDKKVLEVKVKQENNTVIPIEVFVDARVNTSSWWASFLGRTRALKSQIQNEEQHPDWINTHLKSIHHQMHQYSEFFPSIQRELNQFKLARVISYQDMSHYHRHLESIARKLEKTVLDQKLLVNINVTDLSIDAEIHAVIHRCPGGDSWKTWLHPLSWWCRISSGSKFLWNLIRGNHFEDLLGRVEKFGIKNLSLNDYYVNVQVDGQDGSSLTTSIINWIASYYTSSLNDKEDKTRQSLNRIMETNAIEGSNYFIQTNYGEYLNKMTC